MGHPGPMGAPGPRGSGGDLGAPVSLFTLISNQVDSSLKKELKSLHLLSVRVHKDNQDLLDPLDPQVLRLPPPKAFLLPRTITRGTAALQKRWRLQTTRPQRLRQRLRQRLQR